MLYSASTSKSECYMCFDYRSCWLFVLLERKQGEAMSSTYILSTSHKSFNLRFKREKWLWNEGVLSLPALRKAYVRILSMNIRRLTSIFFFESSSAALTKTCLMRANSSNSLGMLRVYHSLFSVDCSSTSTYVRKYNLQ